MDINEIPQDFIDIDHNPDHWVMTGVSGPNEGRRFPDKNLWCVPATEAGDGLTPHSDMTDAMMSPLVHTDNDVEPIYLFDKPWYKSAMAFLMQNGNLGVPGGRYGNNTSTCAHIAILMAVVMRYHSGEEITYYSLNSDMSMVVNSSDDVATLLSESQYILDDLNVDVRRTLGSEYIPQTALEKIAAHCEVEIDDNAGDNGTLSITMDNDDAEKLIAAILSNKGPFYDRQA